MYYLHRMAHIPWDKSVWRKVQGHITDIEGEDSMQNSEIQDKILEIVEEYND